MALSIACGLEHRREQQCRDQGVASEVGVEAPGAGEELVLVAQKGQRIASARVVTGALRQQGCQRHQRRLAGERLDSAVAAARHARRQEALARTHAHRLAPRSISLNPAAPSRRSRSHEITVAGDAGFHHHFSWRLALQLVVAQHAHRRQHGGTRPQFGASAATSNSMPCSGRRSSSSTRDWLGWRNQRPGNGLRWSFRTTGPRHCCRREMPRECAARCPSAAAGARRPGPLAGSC